MNERLEQEVARYLRDEGSKDDEPTISEIATHFYNLALEDVRKEVKRHLSEAETERVLATGVSHDGYCMNLAKENVCIMISNYIDNLTK